MPIEFLIITSIENELAMRGFPETVYILSCIQNASVIHPIAPAVMAPNLAPFWIKNIENAIPKYHKLLRTNQLMSNNSGLMPVI